MTAKDLFEIAEAYEQRGKLDMARRSYARIVHLHPEEVVAYHKLAVLALREGDHAQALAFIDKGLSIDRNAVGLWNNRGLALTELGRADEASESLGIALSLRPDNVPALYNLGRLQIGEGKFAEAEHTLRRACELDPHSADAFLNLGLALHQLYRYDEACEAYDKALAIQPNSVDVLSNKGASQYFAHRLDQAEATFRGVIAQSPGYAAAHANLASVLFSKGDLAGGFRENEWRFRTPGWKPLRSFTRKEQWGGEPLRGETLLVHAEQGLGDSLQFVRYITELAKMDCEIVVDIQPDLYRLCSGAMKFANVRWSRSEALPGSDLQIPLLSVPAVLGFTYETLPPFKPYLAPREAEAAVWRGKLNRMTGIAWGREVKRRKQRRIGLVWSGNPSNPKDRTRSMTFDVLAPIVEAHKDDTIFFSLQKGQKANHPNVIDLGDELTDFGVTAAIVENLDLVISVDTSTAHLAGAMGKQVWTLLSHTPDWRWVLGEQKTKWYPAMSLFWQKQPGTWDNVIAEVIEALSLQE